MIIDFHAHVSLEAFGSVTRLQKEYQRAGIDLGVLVPGGMIDVRRMTKYVTGEIVAEHPVPRNDLVETIVAKGRQFAGFFCADPHQGRAVVDDFERALTRGFSGLKLAPIVHRFSFSSPVVGALLDVAERIGCPVYAHTVFSAAASTRKFGYLASQHPTIPFVIGHMGFGPADAEAVELAVAHDNVFLETSGASFVILEEALRAAGAGKLIFGSEFPMQNPSVEMRKIELLNVTSTAMACVLGGNAAALLRLDGWQTKEAS